MSCRHRHHDRGSGGGSGSGGGLVVVVVIGNSDDDNNPWKNSLNIEIQASQISIFNSQCDRKANYTLLSRISFTLRSPY